MRWIAEVTVRGDLKVRRNVLLELDAECTGIPSIEEVKRFANLNVRLDNNEYILAVYVPATIEMVYKVEPVLVKKNS